MSKTLSGTLTIEAEEYPVTVSVSKNRSRLVVTIVLTEHEECVLAFSSRISGTTFTAGEVDFLSPLGFVEVESIGPIGSTIAEDLSILSFTAEGAIDGAPVEVVLSATYEVTPLVVEGIDADAANPRLENERYPLSPVRVNEVGSVFDHYGQLLSLQRLHLEGNKEFSARIKKASRVKGGCSYSGLVNSITNELGLSLSKQLKVSVRDDAADDPSRLRFVIRAGLVQIYSLWTSEEEQRERVLPILEQEATLGLHPIETIGLFCDWINLSENFQAEILGSTDRPSSLLLDTDSRKSISATLKPQHIMRLGHKNVIPGSLICSTASQLSQEVALDHDLSLGQYKIDYPNGLIFCFAPPTQELKVNFLISSEEIILESSDVKLKTLPLTESQKQLFEQTDQDVYTFFSDRTRNGLPTEEMYRILRQLLTLGNFSQYWGE